MHFSNIFRKLILLPIVFLEFFFLGNEKNVFFFEYIDFELSTIYNVGNDRYDIAVLSITI